MEKLLEEEMRGKNDRGVSVLTSVLYKSLFKRSLELHDETFSEFRLLLTHAKDYWFKNTLDALRDEDTFILSIVDSLGQSLSLLMNLYLMEKHIKITPPILTSPEHIVTINEKYFEPLVQTLAAGLTTLEE